MTLVGVAVGFSIAYEVASRRDVRLPAFVAVVVGLVLLRPTLGLGLLVAWMALRRRAAIADERRALLASERERVQLVQSTLIAATGGMGLAAALELASSSLSSALGTDVEDVLRNAATMGLGAALQAGRGPAGELFHRLGLAHDSGTPIAVSLATYAHELNEQRRSRAIERARQLPVRMVIPLTLLMLPGFLLLLVGPTLLASFSRLLGPFAGA